MEMARGCVKLFSMFNGEGRKEAAAVLFVVASAFLLRYWHLGSVGWATEEFGHSLGMRLTNSSILHFSDSDSYTSMAKDYLEGRGPNPPFNPPMVTFLLIAIYKVFGYDFFSAKTVYALLGSLALAPVYFTARTLFGRQVAFATILLCAASFTLIFITGALNIENAYLLTLSLAVSLFTALYTDGDFAKKHPVALPLVFGLCSGGAMLTRSEFALALALFFLMGIFKRRWSAAYKMRVAVLALIGLLLAVSPWTYRNWEYMKNFNAQHPQARLPVFVPVAMNGPFNFVEGHSPWANGTYAPAVAGELKEGYFTTLNAANPEHLMLLRDGFKLGWEYMKSHPDRELANLPVKLKVFANGFANGFLLDNFPAGLRGGSESMADSFVPDSGVMLVLGLTLFLAGAFIILREADAKTAIPFIPLAAVLFATVMFYGLSRLAYPALPYFFMVMAVAIARLWRRLNVPLARPYLAVTVLTATLLVAGFVQSRHFTVFHKEPRGGYGGFHLTPG